MQDLDFLMGTWLGVGEGKFPTIHSFSYREVLTFSKDGFNDLIHYEQRTWLLPSEQPSHWESGFIKPVINAHAQFEISNSQDSGRVEVLAGIMTIAETRVTLHFKKKYLNNDPRVLDSERIFVIDGGSMSYVKKMSTSNVAEHQQHLQCELKKQS